MGAPVFTQRVSLIRILFGGEISENIRATETVNRLFGITDKKYRQTTVSKYPAEIIVLHRVGVLKLIDQCGLELLTQSGDQPLPLRAL